MRERHPTGIDTDFRIQQIHAADYLRVSKRLSQKTTEESHVSGSMSGCISSSVVREGTSSQ